MNVKELRAGMNAALHDLGLRELRLVAKAPKVWTVPTTDIIRFFWPQAIRRPWGFTYGGSIGIEVPALRHWLGAFKPGGQAGILHSCFVSYMIINDDVLGEFRVEHDKPAPLDLWAGLLKDRLERVPPTLDGLINAYRRNKEELGWLAHPHMHHAWDFLLRWNDNPSPMLQVPRRLPDGRIV